MTSKFANSLNEIAVIEKPESQEIEVPQIEMLRQAKLTSLEKTEMEEFIVRGMPNIGSYPRAELLNAYLTGLDTAELISMFPITSIGGIAFLKAKEGWIEKRKEFLEDLTYKSKLKLLQTKNNAIGTLSLIIEAFHKELKPQLMKYLETGDKSHLPARFKIKGFNDYTRFLKLLEHISKFQTSQANNKQPDTLYPPVSIHAENLTIQEGKKKEEIIISPKRDVSQDSFDFLQKLYDDTTKE